MNIPATIRAGDTVKWRDEASRDNLGNPIDGGSWSLTYYLRTNHTHEGATVAGVAIPGTVSGAGWEFTISSATSADFVADQWFWQAIAEKAGEKVTIGAGQLTVLAALSYSGLPSAFDGRTQAQKDLDAVQAAVRALVSGGAVKQYTIAGRSLTKYDLADLLALESKLKAEVKREQAAALAANGLGNPHNLFVRF